MKILLAVDSVLTAELVMNAVAARPWPRGTRARVLSVVEDESVPEEVWRESGYTAGAVRQEMRRRGEQITALTVEPLRRLGIEAEVVIMRGDPQWLILFEARAWPADLIILRAHNRTDLRSWLLGSVAEAVVRDAPCSVEIVRAAKDELSAVGNGHLKILLATDGTASSRAAALALAERPWPEGTEVKVLSTVNPLVHSIEETGLYDGGGTGRARRAVKEAAQILKRAGVKTSEEVSAGPARKRIIGEARQWGADLIVVGKRNRRGARRLFSGSTSEAVASRAHCSVKVIPERGASL